MAASINDLATKATSTSRATPTVLTANKIIGSTSISCGSLAGWPVLTAVHFIIYTLDSAGKKVASSQTDWKGVVSGNTVTSLVLKAGTDNGYSIGAVVEAAPTSAWANDTFAAITQDHDTLGRHKQLTDVNGNLVLNLVPTTSSVNDLTVQNAAAGTAPSITSEGADTNIGLRLAGKGTGRVSVDGFLPQAYNQTVASPFAASGFVMATSASLLGTIPAGTAYINTKKVVTTQFTKAFTASKDTYIDLKDDGTFAYVEVANNALSGMTLTLNSDGTNALRLAKVVTSATTIAQVLQNGVGAAGLGVSPVAPNTSLWFGFDPLGNIVGNVNPMPTLVGMTSTGSGSQTVTTAQTDINGTAVTIIADGRSNYRLVSHARLYNSTSSNPTLSLLEGSTIIDSSLPRIAGDNTSSTFRTDHIVTPSAGTHIYKLASTGAVLVENVARPAYMYVYKV